VLLHSWAAVDINLLPVNREFPCHCYLFIARKHKCHKEEHKVSIGL